MRLYVTGGTGYLGRELLRLRPLASAERVEIRDAAAVEDVLARVEPDVVVHTAYRQEGPDAWAVTVKGAANVARATREVGARLLHLSTDVVFDGRKGAPYVEEDAPSPCTEYGVAKAAAEQEVLELHPEALVVRTSLIVGGPGGPPSKHDVAAAQGTTVFYEDEIRSAIQVTDLASALLELAASDVTGILHVAGADAISRADLAELVSGARVQRGPAPAHRPLDCTLDSGRARAMLRTELRGIRTVYA